jgi:hypothetical protein
MYELPPIRDTFTAMFAEEEEMSIPASFSADNLADRINGVAEWRFTDVWVQESGLQGMALTQASIADEEFGGGGFTGWEETSRAGEYANNFGDDGQAGAVFADREIAEESTAAPEYGLGDVVFQGNDLMEILDNDGEAAVELGASRQYFSDE